MFWRPLFSLLQAVQQRLARNAQSKLLFAYMVSQISKHHIRSDNPVQQHPPPISSSTQVPPSPVPSEPCLGMGPPKPPRDPLRMSARDLGSRCADHGMFASQSHAQLQREGPQYSSGRRVKRRDSHLRRHTLQGGVDFSMVRETQINGIGPRFGCYVLRWTDHTTVFKKKPLADEAPEALGV